MKPPSLKDKWDFAKTSMLESLFSQRPRKDEASVLSELKIFLDEGANPDGHETSSLPPLALAISNNYPEAATLLLEAGAEAFWADGFERNLMHYAAQHGCPAIIDRLAELYPGLVEEEDTWGLTPIELAKAANHNDVAWAIVAAAEKYKLEYPARQLMQTVSGQDCRAKEAGAEAPGIRIHSSAPAPA